MVRERGKKKSIEHTVRRQQRFPAILMGEGILVGIAAGVVVLLYRLCLEQAGEWLFKIVSFIKGKPLYVIAWFLALFFLAILAGKLVALEPMASGSGIPQVEGEMQGSINQTWYRVLWTKFLGGSLCMLGGLALGREGPSIQLGAMAGKGVAKGLDVGKTEEKFLLTCGASAGLSAAFHAPLAGVMFSLEEIHKNFSVSVLLSVMTASLTADFLCSSILGVHSVFRFQVTRAIPLENYWLLLILGIVLGAGGVLYNHGTLKVQEWYGRTLKTPVKKMLLPFFLSGLLALWAPELLGSGQKLIDSLAGGGLTVGVMLLFLVGRFLFSAFSFGSGAPGGIFFPLLVLGALLGGAFGTICHQLLGLDGNYISNFIILAMAGYFTAIVRAPLTGIILIFEMTGSMSQLLSLAVVSVAAYVTAEFLGSKPIYESLLERIVKGQTKAPAEEGEKLLTQFVVEQGGAMEGKQVAEVPWPDNCLLISIKRGTEEIIPKGKTRLVTGDLIVTMCDERDAPWIRTQMEALNRVNFH